MTALRVGRSKIISNAIVPPSGHHFPLPLEQTFPTVLCAVFAKFEGDILERSWKKKHLLVTICKFRGILVELVLRTIAFLEMNINFRENGILDWYNNMIF